ncbi:hypothetical protein ACH5RR_024793 [Cinchona calisaya]|uniref:Uncharacterized protein n=1 Tax=Cinchona calisaya TaxID=153742 RepID=A0ABD2YXS6_9GENT
MKVILDVLEKLSKLDVNALLYKFGFQHLDTFSVVPLPKRNNNQALRISLFISQYALLLSYLQYWQHFLDPDIPARVLQFLLANEKDNELDLQKVS